VTSISPTVVITGASSGLGKALALRYARDGTVLGLLGRSSDRLDAVAVECRRLGASVFTAAIDVIESSSASYDLMETNVLGVLNSVQPVLPNMMTRGRGQIGIVSSIAGFIPLPDAPTYCASKSAILAYGLALRGALRQSGIGVSVICPGYVATPMMEQESGPKPFAMSARSAADLIIRGMEQNRSIIAFPFWFALVTRIGGLLPDSVRRWTTEPFRFTVDDRK
jgi:short-subunit dehydrogenase